MPNRLILASRFRSRALWIFRAQSQTSDSSPPRSYTGIRSTHHRQRGVQLHTASAARYRRTDFALEPAALLIELENRAGDRSRKHRHRKTQRVNPDEQLTCSARSRVKPVCQMACSTSSMAPARMSALAITAHPKINTISFTGGTVTGRKVAEACAPLFKESVARAWAKIQTSSPPTPTSTPQSPAACARHSRTRDRFVCAVRAFLSNVQLTRISSRLQSKNGTVMPGRPAGRKNRAGRDSKQDATQQSKVLRRSRTKRRRRIALAVLRRKPLNSKRCREGYFFQPTVITGLSVACRTNREEIFGPVVTITPFDSEEEVINYANDVEYGLSSSVWTQNLSRAHRVAERINTGTVWVNSLASPRSPCPFRRHEAKRRRS